MNNEILTADQFPHLSGAMMDFLMYGEQVEIAEAYCESFKDAHGIKARWMLGAVNTPAEWAQMFTQLSHDIEDSINRDKAQDAKFMAMVDSLGLTGWAKDNGIRCEMDLWDHNYRHEFTADPAPFPYDEMTRH